MVDMKVLYIVNPGGKSNLYGSHNALLSLLKEIINYPEVKVGVVIPELGFFSKKLQDINVPYFKIYRYMLTTSPDLKLEVKSIKKTIRYFIMLYRRWRASLQLEQIINDFKPDIIHTNVGPLDIADKICRMRKIPHIWHLREYQDADFGMKFFPSKIKFYNKIHNKNNHCIAITKEIFKYFNLSDKDTVIYDGIIERKSIENRYKLKACNDKNYYLFVGRISEAKGIMFLLTAYAQYVKNGGETKLLIVGEATSDKFLGDCHNYLASNKLSSKVEFIGYKEDVSKYMQEAKALIMPSPFEGFGLVTVEAMFNSCLVVGRNTSGTKEQFDNGLDLKKSEIGIRVNSIDDLVNSLINIDIGDFDTMINDAFDTVCALYSTNKSVSSILAFYEKCNNS